MYLNVKTDSWLGRREEVEEIGIPAANSIDNRGVKARVRTW